MHRSKTSFCGHAAGVPNDCADPGHVPAAACAGHYRGAVGRVGVQRRDATPGMGHPGEGSPACHPARTLCPVPLQESVCSTFGAGVSSACVVDVGASKTSISCVDEGISLEECRCGSVARTCLRCPLHWLHPMLRITLKSGGDEVTRLLHWMLKSIHFPYRDCDIRRHTDWDVVNTLKERICHLQEVCIHIMCG